MRLLPAFLPLALVGCAAAWHDDFDRLRDDLEAVRTLHETTPAEPETDLSREIDLDGLVREARRRNPELRELAARSRAGLEEVRRAGAYDDPRLKFETEGVPYENPSLRRAEVNKIGLSQAIPFPGNLGLKSEAALRDAESMHQMYLERERDVVARLKRAYFEYVLTSREIEVHREHVRLLEGFEKVSEAKFRTGVVSQQDLLRPQVEQVMLHAEVLGVAGRLESAKAAINALLDRPADAPLGEPRALVATEEAYDLKDLTQRALATRPEIRAAELRARGAKAGLQAAERESSLPDFELAFDYWQVPDEKDAWGGMLAINLPWFTGKKAAEARRLGHVTRAEEAALESARNRVRFEVRDAWNRFEAARKALALYRKELLPKSEQTVDVSRASYEKDKASFLDLLDSERSLRDVKLAQIQALVAVESATADLERAVGSDLRRKP
jgi:outer membrane protein TolC